MRRAVVVSGVFAMCWAAPLTSQTTNYEVRRGGETTRERLTVRTGTERSADGMTYVVDGAAGGVTSSTVLQRTAAGAVELFRLRATGGTPATVLAATNGGRLAIRLEVGGAETARELPARPGTLLLDDQAWSLLQAVADAAGPRGAALTLVFPRENRTLRTAATRAGTTVTLTGELTGTLQLDPDGRLRRAELPSIGVQLVRLEP